MLLNIIYLIVGLGLILWGANALTDGSVTIASRFGVPQLIIGMTVVALGTSLPELTVSLTSAIQDSPGMAVGNVVGSNIFNILVIIGITAMIVPIKVDRTVMADQMPLMVVSALALLAMGNSAVLNGGGENVITRVDALLLLLFFVMFLRTLVVEAKAKETSKVEEAGGKQKSTLMAAAMIVAGLAALIYGGDRLVAGASFLAKSFGVSDAVIGLTIVAVGTSLPELATSVVAAVKRQPSLAVGNVVGSNILNVLLILGCSGTVRELPFNGIGNLDLGVMLGATVLFWVFARFFRVQTITRWEGAILVICFLAYMTALLAMQ